MPNPSMHQSTSVVDPASIRAVLTLGISARKSQAGRRVQQVWIELESVFRGKYDVKEREQQVRNKLTKGRRGKKCDKMG